MFRKGIAACLKRIQRLQTSTIVNSYASVIIPSIDITNYLAEKDTHDEDCRKVALSLYKYGILIVKDPRVNAKQNDQFLDQMEWYFAKKNAQFDAGIANSDRTDNQQGIVHVGLEKFKDLKEQKFKLKAPNQPWTQLVSTKDPKWRFHWRVQHQTNVLPKDFPSFQRVMNSWGSGMKQACLTITEMTAIGLGLQKNAIKETIQEGQFYLSPTAADLQKLQVNSVICGFHYDFDLLTIHGRARYPGLFTWTRDGSRFKVQVPRGHLLLQAGKQLQWFTGATQKQGFMRLQTQPK